MPEIHAEFLVYDVFTDRAFGGNPLAIMPDASAIPEAQLQRIAREFNFSESTFVYPPKDPSHSARVRIFTPTQEIPFAGHPTIGTAIALSDLGRGGDLVLELGVGPIPCSVSGNSASFTTRAPLDILARPGADEAAACGGLAREDIRTDRHGPVMASLGLPFVLVELTGPEALARALPVTDAFRHGAATYPSHLDFAVFFYCRDGDAVQARMFAPLDNIPEDPATGSACAALAAFLADLEGRDVSLDIAQGVEMGRPSRIGASTGPGGVTITGQAVKTMEGRLTLTG